MSVLVARSRGRVKRRICPCWTGREHLRRIDTLLLSHTYTQHIQQWPKHLAVRSKRRRETQEQQRTTLCAYSRQISVRRDETRVTDFCNVRHTESHPGHQEAPVQHIRLPQAVHPQGSVMLPYPRRRCGCVVLTPARTQAYSRDSQRTTRRQTKARQPRHPSTMSRIYNTSSTNHS